MATIDDKVVAMSFESSKFEEGVNKTISSLDKLKAKLNFPNAGKGLEEVGKAAKGVDLSHIGNGVQAVNRKLEALRLVGIGVMSQLTTRAVLAGTQFVKSFTLDPLIAGFHNYETRINAVQTILANTGLKGKQGLGQVNAALGQLNTYANKTVYNFSEMARNIGTFTAAGVDLKTSTASIKGIANLAALSGSTSEQASTAMYQLSQAIAAGQVHLQDWNSVVNAGMGGKVFQKALADTAQAMGTLKDGSVKLVGPMKQLQIHGESFRQALQAKPGQKSWLTSDVLTNTLKQFTGDMSKAQLKAQGFSAAQIKAIQSQAAMANHAATNIKTFTQLQQALKEEVATAWGTIFKTIFGDLGTATKLFSAIHTTAENALTIPIYNLNKLLEGWAKLGGRTALIHGLHNAFAALRDVMNPIKAAFRDIFPKQTAQNLADSTKHFEAFTKRLIPGQKTIENIRRTFRGLFAVLDIGKQVISGIFHVFGTLLGVVGHGSGGVLNFTAKIGDFLVHIDKMLKQGQPIQHFFNVIAQAILVPFHALGQFKDQVQSSTQNLHPFQHVLDGLSAAWAKLTGQVGKSGNIISPITHGIGQAFADLGQTVMTSISTLNFNAAATAIGVGFLGALTLTFKKFASGGFDNAIFAGLFKNISGSFGGLGFALKGLGGSFQALSGVMKGLTGNLQAMQQKTKAQALKEIAIALALIAASAVALSLVPPAKLNNALTAITVMLAQLLGAMKLIDKISSGAGFLKLPIIAAGLIGLAVAIDILTLAVLGLSRLSWEQLIKGLGGVGALLVGITVAAKPLGTNSAGLIRAGAGIAAIGIALNILALAVRSFGSMDIATLGKGLGAVAVALASIGLASQLFPSGMIAMGAGLVLVATAMMLLEKSMAKFGAMNLSQIGKGVLGIAGALVAIGLAMKIMPRNMLLQSAALVLVAHAMETLAKAVGSFGGMSIEQIAKGLGTMGAALALLAIGLAAMTGSLPGAAALIVAAGAIAILAPALEHLGSMSWGEIIKSMVALAAAFAVLGIASVALAPAAPAMLALGAALLLIGGGLALAGAGVALVGIGLGAIAVAGPVAVGILIKAFESLAASIPKVAVSLVNGLLSIVQHIAAVAPKFVAAIIKIIEAMVAAIPVVAPKLGVALVSILNVALKVLVKAFPKLVEAGFQMVMALLKGISTHISAIVQMVGTIVVKFLNAVANKIPQIVTAGENILIKFVQGIASNIGRVVTAAGNIIVKFVSGIGNNLSKIVTAGTRAIAKFLSAISSGYGRVLRAGTDLIVHFITGIGNASARIVTAGVNAASKFVRALSSGMVKLVNEGAKAVIKFLNGVADAINKYEPQLIAAGIRIGEAIVNGMITGLGNLAGKLADKAKHLATSIPGKIGHLLGIHSPSKVMAEIGKNIVDGMAMGMEDHTRLIAAASSVSTTVVTAVASSADKLSPGLVRVLNGIGTDAGHSFNAGLLLGLTDTKNPIDQAFVDTSNSILKQISDTNNRIQASDKAISSARNKIAADEKKINDAKAKDRAQVRKSVQGDIDAQKKILKEQAKALAENRSLLATLQDTNNTVINSLDAQKTQLKGLYDQYNNLVKQLGDANNALDQIKQTRDSFATSTADQLGTLPDIVSTDALGNPIDPKAQVNNYASALGTAGTSLADFTNTINQLRDMGLDDATYKKLLNIGPAAEDFAKALLALGPAAVSRINAADAVIQSESQTLGDNASHSLYDAGVNAAQGLVDGLNDQINNPDPSKGIIAAIKKMVDDIVATIKKKLKIKSPSEVFAEIGKFSGHGMAKGFTDSSKVVTDAVTSVSDDAIAAMRSGMAGVSDIIASQIDPNPVIAPVLDLSHVQNAAKKLPGILNTSVSAGQANGISVDQTSPAAIAAGTKAPIQFIQNNQSPESLSPIEVYRQTRNLLSQAKQVLV